MLSPMSFPPSPESAERDPGAPDVLRLLLDNHARFLGFLERRVGSRDEAEDILQEAFVRSIGRTDSLRSPESATAWFYRVLRNALVGLVTVSLPGLVGHLFQAFGPIVSPAMLLGGALAGFGKLLCIGVVTAGVGGILRARAGQPAPLPGPFPSAPMPPRVTTAPPAIPGTGAPEAAPPTA